MKPSRSFILDPTLRLYLPLWKLDGASFASRDAYGHLCTPVGAFWTPQGYDFDGVDDKITVTHHASLDFGLASFYEVIVFKLTKKDVQQALGNKIQLSTTAGRMGLWVGSGNAFSFYIQSSSTIYTTRAGLTLLDTGVWYHIIQHADRPNNTAHIYHNGRLDDGALAVEGGFSTTTNIANTEPVEIGCGYNDTNDATFVCREYCLYAWDITPGRAALLYHDAKRRLKL